MNGSIGVQLFRRRTGGSRASMAVVSAVDRVQAALHRLDEADALGAVVARDDTSALRAAVQIDESGFTGPLAGVPITVKDWIDVAGLACEGLSAQRTGRMPAKDATVVGRLRAAGAIVIAKTQPNADHPLHGRCHHPVDRARTPGGSSSGEASLLGYGATTLGVGSDSGGSIRVPAAWCGVAGFKPSFGLVPDTGHFPRVGGRHDGRTVIGPMARRVNDLVTALRLIAGPDGVDPGCVPVSLGSPDEVSVGELRVALVGCSERPAAPSTAAAVEKAAGVLASLGAFVLDDPLPDHLDEALDITQRYWNRRSLSGAESDQQLRDWDRFSGRLTRAASGFDVVLGPVVVDVAPHHRPLAGEDYVYTVPWSLTGWPAISLPVGRDPATGLPLAVQIAAPRWHDHVVLAVASLLEREFGGPA